MDELALVVRRYMDKAELVARCYMGEQGVSACRKNDWIGLVVARVPARIANSRLCVDWQWSRR